jgi:hypothetical protein
VPADNRLLLGNRVIKKCVIEKIFFEVIIRVKEYILGGTNHGTFKFIWLDKDGS